MEENKSLFDDLQIDFLGAQQLTETSRWAKFLAIVFISLAGIFLLVILTAWNKLKTAINDASENGSQVVITIFIAVAVIAVVVVVLMYFLIRSMNRIRISLRTKDQNLFNSGLEDLKIYFTMYGIISIILLIFNIFTFFTK
jgi:ABC-type uncharacterized transport system fused permease/ATPase subunit